MAAKEKRSESLGGTPAPDDEDTLAGTLANIAFGMAGPSPLGAALGFAGAIAHAMRGTRPSSRAERSAMTFGLSNLEGLFDALEAAGLKRSNPGSILGGIRPDITDPAVQAALAAEAARGEVDPAADTAAEQAAMSEAVSGSRIGEQAAAAAAASMAHDFGGTVSATGTDSGGDDGAGAGAGPGSSDAGGSAAAGEGTGEGGARAEGDAFLVTKEHLKGKDPKGPDTGTIKFTVQDGEMIWVFPRDMVEKYGGPEMLKKIFEAWRKHASGKPKMPKMQRKTAMG